MSEHSRYLFLEFVETFSLVVVANQGAYDLHIFKLTNTVGEDNHESVRLQREYIFKCPKWRERILGVTVVDDSKTNDMSDTDSTSVMYRMVRIYILTSEAKMHVLEVTRRGGS